MTKSPSNQQKITGIIQSTRYQAKDTGWAVFTLKTEKGVVPCTGVIPEGVKVGQDTIILEGEFQKHSRYGDQFSARNIIVTQKLPSGEGIQKFLMTLPQIGGARAIELTKKFGDGIWAVIENDPARLAETKGITENHIEAITAAYAEMRHSKNLLVTLYGYGLTAWQIQRIKKKYKDPIEVVTKSPYRMIEEIDGFGFLRVDEIALKCGIDHADPARVRAGIEHTITEATTVDGHIYIGIPLLEKKALMNFATTAKKMEIANAVSGSHIRAGVEDLVAAGRLILVRGCVAPRDLYFAEKCILEYTQDAAA